MHNTFVEEQVNAFERRQRERQAAMHRMVKVSDVGHPNSWAQMRSIILGMLARMTALSRFREVAAARERS